ncbi:MAG TPA: hypothetical protein VIX86_04545 [Streptosporangiaceae bacterium]
MIQLTDEQAATMIEALTDAEMWHRHDASICPDANDGDLCENCTVGVAAADRFKALADSLTA